MALQLGQLQHGRYRRIDYLKDTVEKGVQKIQFVVNAMAAELTRVLREDYGR